MFFLTSLTFLLSLEYSEQVATCENNSSLMDSLSTYKSFVCIKLSKILVLGGCIYLGELFVVSALN